jgi:hypothetical protein
MDSSSPRTHESDLSRTFIIKRNSNNRQQTNNNSRQQQQQQQTPKTATKNKKSFPFSISGRDLAREQIFGIGIEELISECKKKELKTCMRDSNCKNCWL